MMVLMSPFVQNYTKLVVMFQNLELFVLFQLLTFLKLIVNVVLWSKLFGSTLYTNTSAQNVEVVLNIFFKSLYQSKTYDFGTFAIIPLLPARWR